MSSHLITDRPQERSPAGDVEESPSLIHTDDPTFARLVGFIGALLVTFAGTVLLLYRFRFETTWVSPVSAYMLLLLGLACLLFHAAFDNDVQFRRVYVFFAGLSLLAGGFISVLPWPKNLGDQFGPGVFWMVLGLLFALAFLRNETDRDLRRLTQYIIGAAGALMALVGLLGGVFGQSFALPYGVVLALLGLVYLTAFVSSRGVSDDLGYWSGVGIGVLGLLVLLIALVRSFFPWLFVRTVSAGAVPSFFLPQGVVLIAVSLLFVLFCVGLCSDNRIVVVARRELSAFFFSPIAYLVLFAMILAHWWSFTFFIITLTTPLRRGAPIPPHEEPIVISYLAQWFPIIFLIFIVPVLTMRLLSEENRSGTLEVMLTAPVDEVHVVLGKFFAAFFMFLLLWLPFFLFLVALRMGNQVEEAKKDFDYMPLIGFGVCLCLTGALFVSMGLFFSSLTRDQITSGVLTFAGMLTLTLVLILRNILVRQWLSEPEHAGLTEENVTGWPLILKHVSYLDLWFAALKGKVLLRYMLFPITATILFLFLSVKVLEARKWS